VTKDKRILFNVFFVDKGIFFNKNLESKIKFFLSCELKIILLDVLNEIFLKYHMILRFKTFETKKSKSSRENIHFIIIKWVDKDLYL